MKETEEKPILQGVRVIELASVLAAPSVGMFLAELGAEVIKVEAPAGDVTRTWRVAGEAEEGISAYFSTVNWGKKSAVAALNTSEGSEQVKRLIASADIVLASYKAGSARKLGVDYESVSALNENIIYGEITGFGGDDNRVAYDAVLQAESGFMYLNREPQGEPLKMPVALIDVLAGHQLKEGILLALLRRQMTGKGSYVSVSLFDTALSSLANQATSFLYAGVAPQPQGSLHPAIAPYGEIFSCADGVQILLAIGNNAQFTALAEYFGEPHRSRLANPTFSTNEQRVASRQELTKVLEEAFASVEGSSILGYLHERHVPAAQIATPAHALSQPAAEKLFHHSQQDCRKGIKNFIATTDIPRQEQLTPPPQLGSSTDELFGES